MASLAVEQRTVCTEVKLNLFPTTSKGVKTKYSVFPVIFLARRGQGTNLEIMKIIYVKLNDQATSIAQSRISLIKLT
jgi:hypothetical protein